MIHRCEDCGSKAFTVHKKAGAITSLSCRECGNTYSVGVGPKVSE